MRPFVEAPWPLAALQVQPDRAKLRALQPLVQDGIDNLEPDLGCLDVAREGRRDGRCQGGGTVASSRSSAVRARDPGTAGKRRSTSGGPTGGDGRNPPP